MDFGIIDGVNPPDPSAGGPTSYAAFEPARYAMGDTLRFAERMNLIDDGAARRPQLDRLRAGEPGEEYLVLQPSETADPFTVTLEAGTYAVEWFSVDSRETKGAGEVTVERDESIGFTAPFAEAGPAVLYLHRRRASIRVSSHSTSGPTLAYARAGKPNRRLIKSSHGCRAWLG